MGVSSGIAMEIHYCMGKKAGIEFYGEKDDECGKCGMKDKKSGCCNDEHKFYKISDSHKNVASDVVFGIPDLALVPVAFPLTVAKHSIEPLPNTLKNLSPPGYSELSACIRNCVFRL